MDVLFIGGTGVISSACARRAVESGINLYLLTRGQSSRPAPEGADVLRGDIRDTESAQEALGGRTFDVVVDWVAFAPEHIETDIALFQERTQQYVFISSASVYQTPPVNLPVVESTPRVNPYWDYAQAKIACEERLRHAYREEQFPMTIVRPSHTYDRTMLPTRGGYTTIDRMRKGKKVIVHGDGSSLWTLTHHRDFAKGFVKILGNPRALGEAFHITSDEWLTWNQIYETIAQAAGTTARITHVSSDLIAAYDPEEGASLLGDKAHSMIFDNTKIKRLAPEYAATISFARGAEEIMAWYDADASRQVVDEEANQVMDALVAAHESAYPSSEKNL